MEPKKPLRARAIRISLAVAAAVWIVLPITLHFRDAEDGWLAVLFAVVSWPIGYGLALALCWGAAWLVTNMDESMVYGPAKTRQLELLRGPGLLWINAVAVLFPAAVLVLTLLGLFGLVGPSASRG